MREMIRITRRTMEQETYIAVEGRLSDDGAKSLHLECERALLLMLPLRIDFRDVTFVERGAAELIRRLPAHGVRLVNCSSFVAQQLNIEKEEL